MDDLRLALEPGLMNVIRVELVLDRRDAAKVVTVHCHWYTFSSAETVDLFRVVDGRMVRFASYNRVLEVRSLDD